MPASDKLRLLIWKNCLLQRRHKWQTIFEIASPVLFSLLLILTRCLVDPKMYPDTVYADFSPTYFNLSAMSIGGDATEQSGTIAFSPENELTRRIARKALIEIANDQFGFFSLLGTVPEPIGYKNAIELEKGLTRPKAMDNMLAGIQFDDKIANATEWPDEIVVTLRFPAIMRMAMTEHPMVANWRTNLLFPLFPQSGSREPGDKFGGKTPGYSAEMFLAIQHGISKGIIAEKSGKAIVTDIRMQRLPQPLSREDPLLLALERFITLVIMLGFAYTFVNTVRVVTEEKELQLKETMAIMGLPSWLHWIAWFIKQFSFLFISAILMVILFKVPVTKSSNGEWFSVLTFTPWSIVLFFMILFITVSLAFSFMVSVFFSRANSAASFMGLIWFASYAVFCFTQMLYGQISLGTKLVLSLLSNTAIGFAFQMLVWCEGNGRGLQWDEFFTPISYHDQFLPGHVVLMLVLDIILYMLIAMYVEKILPGLYGVPLPWYFPFTKSFWRADTTISDISEKGDTDSDYNDALLKVVHDEQPKNVPVGVNIKNLSKIYTGRKRVVDHLNIRIYENEITVLLGHNGAGKTTTISMLTGMVPPTSGSATISGYNIVTETELARSSLGICPQHNVLFPDLTVAEHIVFYSRLKGMSQSKMQQEINHFVKLLDLEEKRDVVSANLSGGQKRRLSVAAAMCGDSRVVLLDEPTSGLDPAARRALWDLLQKEKKGRTIILTTHFMDEADVLGDRIAIMSGGRLQCYGTPYFLKKHYGIGYKLTILKAENCDVEGVTRFFREYVPNVNENTNIGTELTYILPSENVSKFPEMLRRFEEIRESMNIVSYGLSVTSLEEVFMKAGTEDNSDIVVSTKASKCNGNYLNNDIELTGQGSHYNPMENEPIKKVEGMMLFFNHLRAMFMKQAFNTWRSKMPSSIQLTWPIINIIISVVLSRSWEFLAELPPLTMNFENGFKRTETILARGLNISDGSLEARAMNAYKDYFKTSKSPGMTLTDIGTMDMAKFYMKLSTTDVPRIRFETLAGATFTKGKITAWFSNYGYHDSAISLALVDNAILRALSPGSSLKFVNHPLPYSLENWITVMATGSSAAFQFSFNLGFCLGFVSSFLVLFVIKERTSGAKLLQKISGLQPAVLWVTAWLWDWLWMILISVLIIITLACFQETTLSTPEELGRAFLVLTVYSMAIVPLHYLASFYFNEAATGFTKMCFVNTFCGCMPFLITEVLRIEQIGSPYYAKMFDYIFSFLPTYNVCRSLRDMSVTSFSILACDGICDQLNISNCTRQTVCTDLNINMCCTTLQFDLHRADEPIKLTVLINNTRLEPNLAFSNAFSYVCMIVDGDRTKSSRVDDDPFLQWKDPGIGRHLIMTVLVGTAAFIIILVKEYELMNKIFYRSTLRTIPPVDEDEDSDVAAERIRVAGLTKTKLAQSSLVCKDLSKFYGSLLAVNRLSFAVDRGECFGLLGINGAGKTTTFQMLTGDSHIGSGDAFVHGLSLKTQIQEVHKHIGYCPQFDALIDNLTAREILHIFCLLRGIPARIGAASALYLANSLGFTQHFDKKVYECSGGTKRKISAAVALLGDSSLVYLDEPTTGMDPASKRLVWGAISGAARGGRSVLLTSHSMEECEALCSRLTVMAGGRLHCLGPLQHLKTKFSQGFTLNVKCEYGPNREADLAKIDDYILENISGAKLIESYLGISTYYLSDVDLPWWRVFDALEAARVLFPIEDYAVSQTTLEQVFLRFSRVHDKKH